MNYLLILLKREWLAINKHLIATISYFILFPLLIFLFVGLPLSEIVNEHISMKYIEWIIPGIWIITSAMTSFLFGISSMNNTLFISKRIYTYLKSPITVWDVLFSLTVWSVIMGFIQLIISIIITIALTLGNFNTIQLFSITLYILPIILFMSILGVAFGSWVRDGFSSGFASLITFVLFAFGFGCFIPLSEFPQQFSEYLLLFPVVGVIEEIHLVHMMERVKIVSTSLTIILSVIIYLVNGAVVQKHFRN